MSLFRLNIVAPDKVVYSGEVDYFIAPGEEGELTVLSHHEPLVTGIREGSIRIKKEKEDIREIPVQKGILEVSHNQATILL